MPAIVRTELRTEMLFRKINLKYSQVGNARYCMYCMSTDLVLCKPAGTFHIPALTLSNVPHHSIDREQGTSRPDHNVPNPTLFSIALHNFSSSTLLELYIGNSNLP